MWIVFGFFPVVVCSERDAFAKWLMTVRFFFKLEFYAFGFCHIFTKNELCYESEDTNNSHVNTSVFFLNWWIQRGPIGFVFFFFCFCGWLTRNRWMRCFCNTYYTQSKPIIHCSEKFHTSANILFPLGQRSFSLKSSVTFSMHLNRGVELYLIELAPLPNRL